jgi:hypothetical protein
MLKLHDGVIHWRGWRARVGRASAPRVMIAHPVEMSLNRHMIPLPPCTASIGL